MLLDVMLLDVTHVANSFYYIREKEFHKHCFSSFREAFFLNFLIYLQASFDGVERAAKSGQFIFERDVRIHAIRPQSTILNGGLPLYVKGYNLNLIQNPLIFVRFNQKSFKSVSER